jgi:hypothetical protein
MKREAENRGGWQRVSNNYVDFVLTGIGFKKLGALESSQICILYGIDHFDAARHILCSAAGVR